MSPLHITAERGRVESAGSILIVDDNLQSARLAGDVLEVDGHRVHLAGDGEECLAMAREHAPDVIVLDRMMPGMSGDEVARRIKDDPALRNIKIIILSAKDSPKDKAAGLESGADDYLAKPYDRRELMARVRVHLRTKKAEDALQEAYGEVERKVRERTAELTDSNQRLKSEIGQREQAEEALRKALEEVERLKNRLEDENTYLRDEIRTEHDFEDIISRGGPFQQVLHRVSQVAPTDASVLILGESGTGKELIARAVHSNSKRESRPLVKVNCAALPANLIESELFGHEKGAFTGAATRKTGRFELADGGTIFLDEIGELTPELQAKMLRVLQEGEFERLGSSRPQKVDVRVIAATNRDLARGVESGEFREDLFFRLNVFPIHCPPLRERPEEIPLLASHFLRRYSAKIGRPVHRIPPAALKTLQAYHWPGNVRELENVIERAVILSEGPDLVLEEALHAHPQKSSPQNAPPHTQPRAGGAVTLKEIEKQSIEEALAQCGWAIEGEKGAASRLSLPPSSLRSRMKKLGIRKPSTS